MMSVKYTKLMLSAAAFAFALGVATYDAPKAEAKPMNSPPAWAESAINDASKKAEAKPMNSPPAWTEIVRNGGEEMHRGKGQKGQYGNEALQEIKQEVAFLRNQLQEQGGMLSEQLRLLMKKSGIDTTPFDPPKRSNAPAAVTESSGAEDKVGMAKADAAKETPGVTESPGDNKK